MVGQDELSKPQQICMDYVKEPADGLIDLLLHGSQKCSILELVQILQPLITAKEDEVRLNAVQLLINVSLQSNFILSEVNSLVDFLCGRLSDKYNIIPVILSGLSQFIQKWNLESQTVENIAKHLFKSVDVQALNQDTRYRAYCVLNDLLQHNLIALKEGMGATFVMSYVNAIEDEQDPRNLLLVFNMTVTVLQNFTIRGAEDLVFDVISCYYPIDFTPPPDSSITVTTQSLVESLNLCFTSTDQLAPHVIPFLLEKFHSPMVQARIQSCNTLVQCLTAYGASCSSKYISLIWSDMKTELFSGTNRDLRMKCLAVIQAMFTVITSPVVKDRSLDPAQFLGKVFNDGKDQMKYGESKNLRTHSLILIAVIKSSVSACGLVADICLPWLCERYTSAETQIGRAVLLDEIINILSNICSDNERACEAAKFLPWKKLESIFLAVVSDTAQAESHSTAMTGINLLLDIHRIAGCQNKIRVDEIVTCVYTHQQEGGVTDDGLLILSAISTDHPAVMDTADLITELVNRVEAGEAGASVILAHILTGSLYLKYSARLTELFEQGFHKQVIEVLTGALTRTQQSPEVYEFTLTSLFYRMMDRLIQLAISEDGHIHDTVILFKEFSIALLKNTERTVDMDVFTKCFLSRDQFKPFSLSSPSRQTMLIAVYTTVLMYGSLSSTFCDVTQPNVDKLLSLAVATSDVTTMESVTAAIGLILNRLDEGSQLNTLKARVIEATVKCPHATNKVWLCVRACQALALRCDNSTEKLLELYVEYLTSEKEAHSLAAKLSELLLQPIYAGRRKVLYKQRFLLMLLPLVTNPISGPNRLTGAVMTSLVCALGSILQSLPETLVAANIDTLYPIMLHNLKPSHANTTTLHLMSNLISTSPEMICKHTDTLFAKLFEITRDVQPCCKPGVRVEAIHVIALCAVQLPLTFTHIQRESVLKCLRTAFGDRKRFVRQAAAQAARDWLMLESRHI